MKYLECYVDNVNKLLTYKGEYSEGDWVELPYRGSLRVGLVINEVDKPSFKVLDICKAIALPKSNLIPLVKWLISYYYLDVNEAFSLVFPSTVFKENIKYSKIEDLDIFNKETLSKQTLIKKIGVKHLKELLKAGKIKESIDIKIPALEEMLSTKIESVTLNNAQQNVVNKILKTDKPFFLLRGVTGSGKTEIYAELAKYGKVLLILPEVALANEVADKLRKRYGRVAVIHSGEKASDLANSWLNTAFGNVDIVVGARSAIFAPIEAKFIIIDEEHEDSYKQNTKPIYDARAAAIQRVNLSKAKLILGSATPSLERYYYTKQGKIILCELDERHNNYSMPKVELVNMQGTKEIFSKKSIESIKESLANDQQVMVIINKRGYANALQCTFCGKSEECKNCSVSMIYFKNDNLLKCAYCDYEVFVSKMCNKCGSFTKQPVGKGVELIEEELKKIDPRVVRFDGDVNKERGASAKIFKDFKEQKIKILVGTKLIAKGLDFPNVSLVLIVDADSTLHFPDFRAAERTFQFMWQAAGRAGRGGTESKVLIQTYNPEHYVFEDEEYKNFYTKEIAFREALLYPPFSRTINILSKSKDEQKAKKNILEVYSILKKYKINSYPPSRSFIYKVSEKYRYHIFIKESKNKNLREAILEIKKLKDIFIDVDPINLI